MREGSDDGGQPPADPITPDEVAEWFSNAMKNGRRPTAKDCAALAERLQDLMEMLGRFPPQQARKPRKGKLAAAFDNLISLLEQETFEQREWENSIYASGQAPASTYSDCLDDILGKVSNFRIHIIDETGSGSPSTLNMITEEIAGRILGVWNLANGRSTQSIGRETPLEYVLVSAISRVTGKAHEASALQSELRRSDQKMLRMFAKHQSYSAFVDGTGGKN